MIAHGHNSRIFLCGLVRNMNERQPFPHENKVQISASTFEDQRLKRTDSAVVHDSPLIGAGPSMVLFRKLEDGELSDKVLSWRAAIKRVTWQLSSKFLCSLSVRVTRRSSNTILGPIETRKLSFRLYIITYRLFALAKTDTENCNTYPRLQTDSGRLAFRFCGPWAGTRRATYLCLDCAKNVDKSWSVTVSFIIH